MKLGRLSLDFSTIEGSCECEVASKARISWSASEKFLLVLIWSLVELLWDLALAFAANLGTAALALKGFGLCASDSIEESCAIIEVDWDLLATLDDCELEEADVGDRREH